MTSVTNTTGNAIGGTDNIPSDPGAELIAFLTSQIEAKQVAVSLLTWVTYDFLLTMDNSINLFWSYHRWSMAKILYLISRYDTLFAMAFIVNQTHAVSPSQTYCNAGPWIQVITSGVLILVLNIAMAARVYALWERSIWILNIVVTGTIINFGAFFVLLPYSFVKAQISPSAPPFTGCVVNASFDGTWSIFVTGIAYETMVIGLTVYKSWAVARRSGVHPPLYSLLLGDGVIYYLLIMASQILSLIVALVPTSLSIIILLPSPSIAVTGVACNHLFTRLQRHLLYGARGLNESDMEDTKTHTFPPRGVQHADARSTSGVGFHRHRRSSQLRPSAADRALVYNETTRAGSSSGIVHTDQEYDLSAHLKGTAASPGGWGLELQDLERRTGSISKQ